MNEVCYIEGKRLSHKKCCKEKCLNEQLEPANNEKCKKECRKHLSALECDLRCNEFLEMPCASICRNNGTDPGKNSCEELQIDLCMITCGLSGSKARVCKRNCNN